jgi:hypothetical protein
MRGEQASARETKMNTCECMEYFSSVHWCSESFRDAQTAWAMIVLCFINLFVR